IKQHRFAGAEPNRNQQPPSFRFTGGSWLETWGHPDAPLRRFRGQFGWGRSRGSSGPSEQRRSALRLSNWRCDWAIEKERRLAVKRFLATPRPVLSRSKSGGYRNLGHQAQSRRRCGDAWLYVERRGLGPIALRLCLARGRFTWHRR